MTKESVIKYACSLECASCDSPFENDFESVVLRHTDTRKWFGLIMKMKDDRLILNLKCDPMESEILKKEYKGITEAYHMNKRLWITIYLDADVSDDEIKNLIRQSFELTKK